MDEIETLFGEALTENDISEDPLSFAEKIVKHSEEEFKGFSGEEKSRQDEEKEIRECIKTLEVQLQKCKNVKNHKLAHLNAKRSEKRKEIKKKISILTMRLQEINDERSENSKK